jgi:hypothetical protein
MFGEMFGHENLSKKDGFISTAKRVKTASKPHFDRVAILPEFGNSFWRWSEAP